MAKCEKCGWDPDHLACPLCGSQNVTLGNYGGKLLTVCCQKALPKPLKGGK